MLLRGNRSWRRRFIMVRDMCDAARIGADACDIRSSVIYVCFIPHVMSCCISLGAISFSGLATFLQRVLEMGGKITEGATPGE